MNTKDTPMDYKQLPHEQLQKLLTALESETIPMVGHQDPGALKDCWRLASDLVEEIINDSSHLAAVTCPHAYGDEGGNQRCSEIDRLKLELQKQKELNAELVLTLNSVSNAFHTSNLKYIDWMPTHELNESMRLLEVLLNKVNNP